MNSPITEKEARILACIQLRADLPHQLIAKETGLRIHTVRYCLERLQDRAVIRRTPLINIIPAGYTFFGIYFSPGIASDNTTNALLKELIKRKEIVWLAELGGEFEYGMAVCVRDIFGLQDLLEELSTRYPNLFHEKSVACQFSATFFARGYLSARKFQNPSLTVSTKTERIELDQIDQKILGGMTIHEHRSIRQLAQVLGLPMSTMDLRVKRLKEKKIFLGYIYQIEAEKVGLESLIALLYTKGTQLALRSELQRFGREHPNVTHLFECLGAWDFELNVELPSGKAITHFKRELIERFGAYTNAVKIFQRYRDLKWTHVPF